MVQTTQYHLLLGLKFMNDSILWGAHVTEMLCVWAAVKQSFSPCQRWTCVKLNKTIYFSSHKFAPFIEIIRPLIEEKRSGSFFSSDECVTHGAGRRFFSLRDRCCFSTFMFSLCFCFEWLNKTLGRVVAVFSHSDPTPAPDARLAPHGMVPIWNLFSWLKASSWSKQEKQVPN